MCLRGCSNGFERWKGGRRGGGGGGGEGANFVGASVAYKAQDESKCSSPNVWQGRHENANI